MNINHLRVQSSHIFKIFYTLLALVIIFLCVAAYKEYKGESYIYVLFTITSTALLYSGFRKNAIFFDTFIGIFFWLGFWLKLTVRVAFMESQINHAGWFTDSGADFDRSLLVVSCGFLGLLVASYLRGKFIFNYPLKINEITQQGLFAFYNEYKKYLLVGFVVLIVLVAYTNYYYGIYQRGTITRTSLPYGLNGIYKWLLLFGLASISAMILKFEYSQTKKTSYFVAILSLMEAFVSNVSLLSRGMILNVSALVYGVMRGLKIYSIKSSFRFLLTNFTIFIVLFSSSVVLVNYIRSINYIDGEKTSVIEQTSRQTKVLFLDRWVGIEGVMAVSSYPKQGWDLWRQAWKEEYNENKMSFYDENILVKSSYRNTDMTKHHFISLPGILAFCFYSGSFAFLFLCMFLLSIFASIIEMLVFRLGGKNIFLCALLAQVIAYRFSSFGYVPAQSYLLFGALILNIILIYGADKFFVFWYRRRGILS